MNDDRSSQAAQPSAPRRMNIVVAVSGLLLVVALGGVWWVLNQPLGPSTVYTLTTDGEAPLKAEAARRGLPVGQPAPGFTAAGKPVELTSLSGDRVQLSDYLGRPVWLVFWATYCHACKLEEPAMRRAFDTYRADGLALLAIDIGEDADTVRRYVQANDLPWTILLDTSGTAVDAFGAIGTPSHFFIATDGTIQSRAFGRLDDAEMEKHLATLVDPVRSARGATAR